MTRFCPLLLLLLRLGPWKSLWQRKCLIRSRLLDPLRDRRHVLPHCTQRVHNVTVTIPLQSDAAVTHCACGGVDSGAADFRVEPDQRRLIRVLSSGADFDVVRAILAAEATAAVANNRQHRNQILAITNQQPSKCNSNSDSDNSSVASNSRNMLFPVVP